MRHVGKAWLVSLVWLGGARTAAAQDDAVRVTCAALTPEATAEVEARARATLLTTAQGSMSVRVECAAEVATVRVTAGERGEATELVLPVENPQDALFAALERTLHALERSTEAPPLAAPAPPPASPVASAPSAAPPPSPPPPRAEPARPAPALKSRPPRWEVGAGVLTERWDAALAIGARVRSERRFASWSVGAAIGWLYALDGSDAFGANELHAFTFIAPNEEKATGLRASLGAGVSVLAVAPSAGIVVRSETVLEIPFLNAELSRPLRFGAFWLAPAIDVRLFPGPREVNVDRAHRLVLPPVCPTLFLGAGYAI